MGNQHYYTNSPTVQSNEQLHQIVVAGLSLKLWTDNGVFSKNGLDFGSRVLIETIVNQVSINGNILDVGCGYGPIGISLAKLTKQSVIMSDVNERAVELTKKNALQNGVVANVLVSSVYGNIDQTDFDLIVSNPPIRAGKDIVHGIIAGSFNHLQKGGKLVIVIQKKQGAPSAEKKMNEIFGNVELLAREKGYWILMSVKEIENESRNR